MSPNTLVRIKANKGMSVNCAQAPMKMSHGLLNNIRGEELSRYWGVGVHKNCAVTEVEVTDGIPRIISENVAYYDDEIEPWEE